MVFIKAIPMSKYVKFFILFLMMCSCSTNFAINVPPYEDELNKILAVYVQEMNKTYGITYYGRGGQMHQQIKKIEVMFALRKKMTVEEARQVEVLAEERLLFLINNSEKLKPYLNTHPFTINEAQVSISVLSDKNGFRLDGSVTSIFIARGKIMYRAAELQKRKNPPIISPYDLFPNCEKEQQEYLDEVLIPLYEEPYEEALKIVRDNACCINEGSKE